MTTDLIRWQDNGYGGYLGYAGTLESWLFQVYRVAWRTEAPWVLTGTLPGHAARGALAERTEPDLLKAKAEELLRTWTASIGAVFPEPGPGGYVTAYAGRRKCRYCPERARWDIGGSLACSILTHVGRALEDLTAPKTGDDL